ncbi:MAG: CvpA family protein [Archangium sp.]|nr:CvpA family protein [Archangium sp.]
MTLDLVALIIVAFLALFGALSGFSKQVAQAIAGVVAIVAAGPAGSFFGEGMAHSLKSSLTVGIVAATIVAFILIYIVVRLVLTAMIKRLIQGKDPENRSADRALGLMLAVAKGALAIWIGASAATFVENNLVLNGKKYTFTPKDSQLVAFSRRFNFIEMLQFSNGRDLALAAKVANDPKQAEKLKADPDYVALMKDPRFRKLASGDAWKTALETGDVRGLMQSNEFVELLQDARLSHSLERLAERGY